VGIGVTTGTACRKVPHGKLLAVSVEHDGGCIRSVLITGDFFVHPEEGLELIERSLAGIDGPVHPQELEERISEASEGRMELIGFQPSDLAALIMEAIR
jgi:lipoate---protein ligase